MNRQELLVNLKKMGCPEAARKSPDKIKAWIEAEGVVPCLPPGEDGEGPTPIDIDEAWATLKTVQVMVQPDRGIVIEGTEGEQFEDLGEGGEEENEEGEEPPVPDAETVKQLKRELTQLKRTMRGKTGAEFKGMGVLATQKRMTPENHRNILARKRYERKIAVGKAMWPDVDRAEQFGAWARQRLMGFLADYPGKAADLDICRKANVRTQNTSGGALVPDEFEAQLIELREQYGVAETLADVSNTTDGRQRTWPRKTGELTVQTPDEGGTITESNLTVDSVLVTPKELKILTTISSELLRDSAIEMTDAVSRAMAWALAKKVDDAFFVGDGTSTHFGVTGVTEAIKGLSGTIANIAGLKVGAGNAYSELTIRDFNAVIGLLPDLEGVTGDPAWVCNKRFFHNTMSPLSLAQGGVSRAETEQGMQDVFLGDRVVFARSMPRTEANSQVACLYGHFDFAAKIVRVTGSMELMTSDQRYFDQDKIAIRAKDTIGVTVHDVGNASATEASREPGPVVGLITAAA